MQMPLHLFSCFWGDDRDRYQALESFLCSLDHCSASFSFVLHFHFASNLPVPPLLRKSHVTLSLSDYNEAHHGLWQKEEIFNYQFFHSSLDGQENCYCYFVDADVLLTEDWFLEESKWRNFLQRGGVVQGFAGLQSEEGQKSFAWHHSLGQQKLVNPGLIWGISSKIFSSRGGFPSLPEGSGDSAWAMEVSGSCFEVLTAQPWFNARLRPLPPLPLDYFRIDVLRLTQGNSSAHFHYNNRTRFWQSHRTERPLYYSAQGLLSWNEYGKQLYIDYHSPLSDSVDYDSWIDQHKVIPRLYHPDVDGAFFDFTFAGFAYSTFQKQKWSLQARSFSPKLSHKIVYHHPLSMKNLASVPSEITIQVNQDSCVELFTSGRSFFDLSRQRHKLRAGEIKTFHWLPNRMRSSAVGLRLTFEIYSDDIGNLEINFHQHCREGEHV